MSKMRLGLAVVAMLATAFCGAPPSQQNTQAPPFDLPNIAGGRTTLASYQGKIVVVDFWATWCGPCIKEIPEYTTFYAKYKERGLEMLGVIFDSGTPEEIREFLQKTQVAYPQALGEQKQLDEYKATQGFPTTFVIGRKGEILKKIVGAPAGKFEELQKAVDQALSAQ